MRGPVDFPPFRLEAAPLRLSRGGDAVPLRPKVLAVLAYLVAHPGRAVAKDELLEAVWPGTAVDDAAVKVCIRELRRALGDDAQRPAFIETLPGSLYRFVGRLEGAVETEAGRAGSPLVGRDAELAALAGVLGDALGGRRRVALLCGDAGIGKTSLVERFLAVSAPAIDAAAGRAAVGRCDERHGGAEPFYPFLEAIGRSCTAPGGRTLSRLLRQHAPSWLLQLPGLLRPDERAALAREYAAATRERMLRELVVGFEAITEEMPLVLVLEDLHWADPSTLDLLLALARRRDAARLLLVGTFRSGEGPPVARAAAELRLRGFAHEIELGPLGVEDVDRLLALRLAERERAQQLAPSVHRHTGGHPLFLVHVVDELARDEARAGVRAAGAVVSPDASRELAGVPPRLREMVAEQIERMAPEDRLVLDGACAAGLEMSAAAVAAAVEGDLADVEQRLAAIGRTSRLLRALPAAQGDPLDGRLAGNGAGGAASARFAFVHAFHRDLLYESLTPAWRARLHARIGDFLERSPRGPIDLAPELAHHFELAGDAESAIRHLEAAAESAIARHADHAAADYLGRALGLLGTLPAGPQRDATELRLRAALGPALLNTRGFANDEVESCYARALDLCAARGESAELFPVLEGLQSYFSIRGPLAQAHALSRRMDRLARRTGERLHHIEADHVMGCDLVKLGRFADACRRLERAVGRYDVALADDAFRLCGHDPRVCCLAQLGVARSFLGDAAGALRDATAGAAWADELRQPMSIALGRFTLAWVHLLRGEPEPARALLEGIVALADEEGLPYWSGYARMFLGWARGESGDASGAAEALRTGYEVCQLVGPEIGKAEHAVLAVRAGLVAGDEVLALLDAAEAILHARGERYLDAELDILRADALLVAASRRAKGVRATRSRSTGSRGSGARGSAVAERTARAERLLTRAIAAARRLGARSSELRAATRLAQIARGTRREKAAAAALRAVVDALPAVDATRDLRQARRVLGRGQAASGRARPAAVPARRTRRASTAGR